MWLFQEEVHKAEAGDMLGVVGSLLSAGTHLKKKTDLQLKINSRNFIMVLENRIGARCTL